VLRFAMSSSQILFSLHQALLFSRQWQIVVGESAFVSAKDVSLRATPERHGPM
jgi:hypothetical protein